MSKQTYEVSVTADAYRVIKVRASSGCEALDIAESRIRDTSGPWSIQFPGGSDEHYSVYRVADGAHIGPNSQGGFDDEEDEEAPNA